MNGLLWILGLLGHAGIWATAYNQIHATACPKASRKILEKAILLIVFLPILFVLAPFVPATYLRSLQVSIDWLTLENESWLKQVAVVYGAICVPAGIFFAARWGYRKLTYQTPTAVRLDQSEIVNVQKVLGQPLLRGWFARTLGCLPFNQVQLLDRHTIELVLDLPNQLDGLRICHLSDLHFTGQLDRKFFEYVVAQANEFEPHLTMITGDLIDKDKCIAWLPDTLGRLTASIGRFLVLGNHDLMLNDQQTYLNSLKELGLERLNSGWKEIDCDGALIRIAGNELPWYSGAEGLPNLGPPTENELRLLLTHTPDQMNWACQHHFSLVLAGHNHGGQISFPLIGPVIVPSRYGVKYASGTFEKQGMLIHVSRGISGDEPIRICCPPELSLITLRSSQISTVN
jgi:predicted MPP superfamily phosphohydrolase